MNAAHEPGRVIAVCLKKEPGLPKLQAHQINLVKNFGVEGDYHAGKHIRHRYLAKQDPSRPNNRQVLVVDTKIHALVKQQGIQLEPGDLGENILLEGIDLMALEIGTRLELGSTLIELTEIREPCYQLDGVHPGLERAVERKPDQAAGPMAGMLGVVLKGGPVREGDMVRVVFSQD